MSTQTISTLTSEEEERIKRLTEKIKPEQLPLLLLQAMRGKVVLAEDVTSEEIQFHIQEEQNINSGYILTKNQIRELKLYIKRGLQLPQTAKDVRKYLEFPANYDSDEFPDIAPEAFAELFQKIRTHCLPWFDIESNIKKTGMRLDRFSKGSVTTYNRVSAFIDQMPIMEKFKKLSEEDRKISVPLGEQDKEILLNLRDILSSLQDNSDRYGQESNDVLEQLESFAKELENNIIPSTVKMDRAIDRTIKETESEEILKRSLQGTKNVVSMWQVISFSIEEAKTDLTKIDGSIQLSNFQTKLETCANSWNTVQNYTEELLRLFEEAEKEAAE